MTAFFQRVSALLAGCVAIWHAQAEAPAPCALEAPGLRIEVRSEPDDGVWGPTMEIVVRDALRPLSRLMAPETRPIEACWWGNVDADTRIELVIGVGTDHRQPGGALVYEWDGQALHRTEIPPLPPAAVGVFRYIVRNDRIRAYPITDGGAPYRLEPTGWLKEGAPSH